VSTWRQTRVRGGREMLCSAKISPGVLDENFRHEYACWGLQRLTPAGGVGS
jgi:hypothetical protein